MQKSNESNLVCRFCSETEETQEHILQTCQKVERRVTKIKYEDVFKEEASKRSLRRNNQSRKSTKESV